MLRLGIVGTAHWATAVHGAAARAAEGVTLAGVWGRDPGRTELAAGRLACPAFGAYDDLVGAVDALCFAVPPDVQARLAVRAAEAGRHLLLEKPLALTPAAADAIVGAARATGVATALFVTRRWIPETAAWLDEQRAAGPWESGRVELVAAVPPALLDASPWRREHGALWDVGPHALSLLERVLGPVTAVVGLPGVRDTVHLGFDHGGGRTSSAELTLTATPAGAGERAQFRGPHGRSGPMPPVQLRAEHNLEAATAALAALVRRAAGSEEQIPDAAYGAHVTRVLTAAAAALAAGSRQPVVAP